MRQRICALADSPLRIHGLRFNHHARQYDRIFRNSAIQTRTLSSSIRPITRVVLAPASALYRGIRKLWLRLTWRSPVSHVDAKSYRAKDLTEWVKHFPAESTIPPGVQKLLESSSDGRAFHRDVTIYDAEPANSARVSATSATGVSAPTVFLLGEVTGPPRKEEQSTLFMYADASMASNSYYEAPPVGLGIVWQHGGNMSFNNASAGKIMHKMTSVAGVVETSFAELLAIYEALDVALESCRSKQRHTTNVWVYSDSRSALAVIARLAVYTPKQNGVVKHILNRLWQLKDIGVQVSFSWVKGHASSMGNILADRVAGAARRYALEASGRVYERRASSASDARRLAAQQGVIRSGVIRSNPNSNIHRMIGEPSPQRRTKENTKLMRSLQRAREILEKYDTESANVERVRYQVDKTALKSATTEAFESYLSLTRARKEKDSDAIAA